jgi:hypothetical protein
MTLKKSVSAGIVPVDSPKQLSLFEVFTNGEGYSNTIELYDALPKYNWAQKREYTNLEKDGVMSRSCTLRGKDYTVVIRPAVRPSEKGKGTALVYPGVREELVEDVLRKLAASGSVQMTNKGVGVIFTLNQVRRELSSMGHSYNIAEIKEALQVCASATLECYADDGEALIQSTFFPTIALSSRKDYLNHGSDAVCYAVFHPMVTQSIMDLSFRRYNYKLGMSIPSPLARFIHKRMSHYWIQASETTPYTPKLVSFLSQSPRGLSEDMYSNTRAMNSALEILVKHEVISNYVTTPIKSGRKIVDAHYLIYPHANFIRDIRNANYENSRHSSQIELEELLTPKRLKSSKRKVNSDEK